MSTPPPIWTTGTTEVFKTGSWRSALPRHIRAPSPCHVACPVGGDIAEWIGRAREGDLGGAFDILVRHNPFPAVSGRICHHPCETACNRKGYDEPLSICRLERHVGDRALAEGWPLAAVPLTRPETIAVVGGGPSGLSAAFHLRRRGYRVTLLDARRDLGGVMRAGIPAYRLPRPVLDGEIARIIALGIEVQCAELATAAQFDALRARFDAVYLAIGAARPRRLPVLDYTQRWVMDGAAWLAAANAGAPPPLGRRIVVVGGGSAAMDVARSARRAGHAVTVLALEAEGQLPAQREEVTEACEEGIEIVPGAMLTAAAATAGHDIALGCVRVRFEPAGADGRFRATPFPDSGFSLRADAIVTAIGQDPELDGLAPALTTRGDLIAVDERQATPITAVYAGGDAASMARFVTEAIGMGKRAAAEIDRALRARAGASNGDGAGIADASEAVVALASINTFYYDRHARVTVPPLDPVRRIASHDEVQRGFDPDRALEEAARCFSCGTCIDCDNCVVYCPDLAVRREGGGYVVLADYCKGCGLCVEECPTGSMKMVEELR